MRFINWVLDFFHVEDKSIRIVTIGSGVCGIVLFAMIVLAYLLAPCSAWEDDPRETWPSRCLVGK